VGRRGSARHLDLGHWMAPSSPLGWLGEALPSRLRLGPGHRGAKLLLAWGGALPVRSLGPS
jgi:hypothetical protein